MQEEYLARLFAHLKKRGIKIDRGFSDGEVEDIEKTYSFKFPPDLRAFLQFGVPASNPFVGWRGKTSYEPRERLSWPLEGIQFDLAT